MKKYDQQEILKASLGIVYLRNNKDLVSVLIFDLVETLLIVSTNINRGDIITKYEICFNGIFLFSYRFTSTRRNLSRCLISTERFRSEIVASFCFCIVLYLPFANSIGNWFQRKDFVQKAHNINTIFPYLKKVRTVKREGL